MQAEQTETAVQRDIDLIRDILLAVEASDDYDGATALTPCAGDLGLHCSEKVLQYHLALLVSAGLLNGKSLGDCPVIVWSISWSGHEYLDSVRDAGVWADTKRRIVSISAGATLETIKIVAESVLRKKLGLV